MTSLVLGLLALLGFFLLIAGVRLIGLVAAFTGGAIGWCLGGALHQALVPEWSVAACAATAALAGAALGALFIRPAVAVWFAVIGLGLGLLLGGVMVERGITPTAPVVAPSTGATAAPEQPATALKAARSGLIDLFGGTVDELQDAHGNPDRFRAFAGIGGRLVAQLKSRWEVIPSATRTFLTAMTLGGAAIGFGIGIVFSTWAVAGASSALGAILLLGCGLPLGATVTGAYRCPQSIAAWLLLIGAFTLGGWAFQMRRFEARKQAEAKKDD